jgi:hypothetical protein
MENIYETGECPKVFIEVIMIASKKKLKSRKIQPHHTYGKDSSEDT